MPPSSKVVEFCPIDLAPHLSENSSLQQHLRSTLTRKRQPNRGLYIKYVGGGRRVFLVVVKYFMHILIGHENIFKTCDGPKKYFLMFHFHNFIF